MLSAEEHRQVSRGIALLNFGYWPDVRRGSERLVHDLATALAARGHTPRVITSHRGRARSGVEDGIEVIRSRRPPEALLRRARVQEHLLHVPSTYRALARGDDDVAHAFFHTDALAALAWSRRRARPCVFSYMGVPNQAGISASRLRRPILDRVIRGSDAVVALSKAAREGLAQLWGIEPRVIYPGVELRAFGSVARARHERPTIVCAASPDDGRKRVPLLVEAFRRVRQARADARLVLMRPQDARIESELAGPGVEFQDLTSEQVPSLFASAWISVLPARDEAFGLVVVESLAAGVPVVAAASGGPKEILDRDGLGVLFESPDAHALSHALLEALDLARDPEVATRTRERAADFSIERCAAEHERLYEELLER